MDDGLTVLSYTLATIAGVFFVGGLTIITGGRVKLHGETGVRYIHAR